MNSAPNTPPASGLVLVWRAIKGVVIFLVVVFHLVVLLVRNPLDLWHKEIYRGLYMKLLAREGWDSKKAASIAGEMQRRDEERVRGILEGHSLTPEELEEALAAHRRLRPLLWIDHFSRRFVNIVGCEQNWCMFSPRVARRAWFLVFRYEFADGTHEYIIPQKHYNDPTRFFQIGGWQMRKLEDTFMDAPSDPGGDDLLFEAYARHAIKRWKQANPDDPRQLTAVNFAKRRLFFPNPSEDSRDLGDFPEEHICAFNAEGRLQR